ncbi:hypothetical protein LJY25_18185 [Hymenobacter sp. BT175]|uniref:hypothetical protein n=1 Tax=Hymenobacter translucens TaxID=2886507 RepID=UPI001D0F1578|nr:hypothetical protein [Hymenobacter translucens]MCC2548381.1 hypothetical protein [Hymenobacter translucens]
MNDKKTGLEAFVERNRADFDAFEPRPDLWEAIEQNLAAAGSPEEAPLRVLPLHVAPQAQPARPTRRYLGIAAAVGALLLAGGTYLSQHSTDGSWIKVAPTAVATTESAAEPSLFYEGPDPVALEATNAAPQRLTSAVQRMEAYYATQIGEKQQELQQLDQEPQGGSAAEWRNELSSLDSAYNQLKTELYRNPEPTVVLDAMNRNLQIRLDILNQQLRSRERVQAYSNGSVPAEGRQQP